jgi:ubiquinone biosynthesis protein COQ9
MAQSLLLACRSAARWASSLSDAGMAGVHRRGPVKLVPRNRYGHNGACQTISHRQDGSSRPPHQQPRLHARRSVSSPMCCGRSYHSEFHPPLPTHEYTNSQTAILSAALKHVREHGFTLRALTLGARDVGFLDVSVQLLPRREFDLVLFWLASRRGLLRAKVEGGLFATREESVEREGEGGRKETEPSIEEKVRILVMERLRMNEEIVHQWQDVSTFPFLSPFPKSL